MTRVKGEFHLVGSESGLFFELRIWIRGFSRRSDTDPDFFPEGQSRVNSIRIRIPVFFVTQPAIV